ncbi:tRNA glutamyl-Q(34) synthetase GluQRS [Marinomonas epiphytica]
MSTAYRGRFAPSPTGPLHFGSLVSALASYLDAKQQQGKWLIRIEDVDGTRCSEKHTQDIIHTLASYGLISDEGIRQQSLHHDCYENHLAQLIEQNWVFPCNCTRRLLAQQNGLHTQVCHSSHLEPHSWRLKSSHEAFSLQDPIQGPLHFEHTLNQPVLKRKDGFFSYQLAVVVDDHLQQISHLVRGADLIETTAQQLQLYKIFQWDVPSIAHIPLITNQDGAKLSKQNHAKGIMPHDHHTLLRALSYLGIETNKNLSIKDTIQQAIFLWEPIKLVGKTCLPIKPQDLIFL